MPAFDPESFRQFLGSEVHHKTHSCGDIGSFVEARYIVTQAAIVQYRRTLNDTIYAHHSAFDVSQEMVELGFPLSAQAMRDRNSGNPLEHNTMMGNIGEILGVEFAKSVLGFETMLVFPKRFNTNVDQAMKGADVIGLRELGRPSEILIGEVKTAEQLNKEKLCEAYDSLVRHRKGETSRKLHHIKEIARLEDAKTKADNVDRHMAQNVPQRYLILSVTQTKPINPFDVITEKFRQTPLPRLLLVHIQVCELIAHLSEIYLASIDVPHA